MPQKTKLPETVPDICLKDQRIQMMMSEGEVLAIDNWSFANRVRGRSEAIRRLCAIALAGAKQDAAS